MWSIIAASVVLLPLPVVPVTSTRPRSSPAIFFSTAGQAELLDRANLHRNDAQDQPDRTALLEDVAAETAEPGDAVGEVDFLRFLELLALGRRHHRGADRDDVLVVEPLVFGGRGELAADAHHRVAADLDVQVGRAVVDGNLQKIVDMHGVRTGLGIGGRG